MPNMYETRQWSDEQLNNARIIIQVGRSLGASDRDLMIALMAAMQESGLRNLDYGDRDSLGLFQQRGGWASASDRMNPAKAARMFFTGGAQGQKGLLDFAQRNQWTMSQAAQKVQVSAFPDAYGKHQGAARSLLDELMGSTAYNTKLPPIPHTTVFDSSLQPSTGESNQLANQGDESAARGIESPTEGLQAAAPGAESPEASGIESADKQPNLISFLPAEAPPGMSDAETFSSVFPKAPGVMDGARNRVIQLAKNLFGTPYEWGGSTPDQGLDCSGLVQYVLGQVGVHLPRISNQQANSGRRVGIGSLRPGDLVAWDNSPRNNGADHIAIYAGNGMIIEAPHPGSSVRMRALGKNEGAYGVALDY